MNVTSLPAKRPHFDPPQVDPHIAAAQQHYNTAQAHDAFINILRQFSIGSGNQEALDKVTLDLTTQEESALKLTREAYGANIASWPPHLQALDYIRAQTIDDLKWVEEGDDRVRRHALLVHIHRAMGVSCVTVQRNLQ